MFHKVGKLTNIHHHTKLQNSILNGTSVSPNSEVCMLQCWYCWWQGVRNWHPWHAARTELNGNQSLSAYNYRCPKIKNTRSEDGTGFLEPYERNIIKQIRTKRTSFVRLCSTFCVRRLSLIVSIKLEYIKSLREEVTHLITDYGYVRTLSLSIEPYKPCRLLINTTPNTRITTHLSHFKHNYFFIKTLSNRLAPPM